MVAIPSSSPYYNAILFGGGAGSTQSQSAQQATGQQQSGSYIPNYSETPILENIANYSAAMAPQVYQWGMQQYANNQGNIDALMRNALTYASPQRISTDMGMAESGVAQGAEAGRQSAISDLQSYGIDPSAGRYAALDQASRVTSGAAAAGAGNQQRMADIAQGNAMQNQAISSSLQNVQTGYGAANAANAFAGTGMNLKYSPLGTQSSGSSQSSGETTSMGSGTSGSGGGGVGGSLFNTMYGGAAERGGTFRSSFQAGGEVPEDDATTGGFVSQELSPSDGAQTDDVKAQLNAGEFVVPKDVSAWKGLEFFYKLMAQARKDRAMAGNGGQQQTGYGAA
jgi:hypothetical protein